jgi:hypothetical protein
VGARCGVWDRRDLNWIEPSAAEEAVCRALCARCPVRVECLEAALGWGEPWGIWGGTDLAQRQLLALERGTDMPRVLPAHGTNPRYAKHGCRCDVCRAAHAVYERERRLRRAS